ncbi:hypothetical protein [Aeromonas veronii]|uniref:hypothetical protein n=1 Tax=Aeromonas veronii TaxID=654 RepID=UPI003D1E2038
MKVIQHISNNGEVTFLLDTNQGDPVPVECIMGFETPNPQEQAKALGYYADTLFAEKVKLKVKAHKDAGLELHKTLKGE